MGIDYDDHDASYFFTLSNVRLRPTPPRGDTGAELKHFGATIQDLKKSDYISSRHHDCFDRTVLDLNIMDRLRSMEYLDTYHHIQISKDINLSVDSVDDIYGNAEVIKSRADWVIAYGRNKSDVGDIVLVLEANDADCGFVGRCFALSFQFHARWRRC